MSQGFRFTKPEFLDPLQSGPVRTNFNAIGTLNYGPTAPSDPEPGMPWIDTSNPANLRLRVFINNQFVVVLNNIAGGFPSQSAVELVVHEQGTPATIWSVAHNLGTRDLIVQTWDENDIQMIPDQVAVLNQNQIQISFFAAQAGKAVILG